MQGSKKGQTEIRKDLMSILVSLDFITKEREGFIIEGLN